MVDKYAALETYGCGEDGGEAAPCLDTAGFALKNREDPTLFAVKEGLLDKNQQVAATTSKTIGIPNLAVTWDLSDDIWGAILELVSGPIPAEQEQQNDASKAMILLLNAIEEVAEANDLIKHLQEMFDEKTVTDRNQHHIVRSKHFHVKAVRLADVVSKYKELVGTHAAEFHDSAAYAEMEMTPELRDEGIEIYILVDLRDHSETGAQANFGMDLRHYSNLVLAYMPKSQESFTNMGRLMEAIIREGDTLDGSLGLPSTEAWRGAKLQLQEVVKKEHGQSTDPADTFMEFVAPTVFLQVAESVPIWMRTQPTFARAGGPKPVEVGFLINLLTNWWFLVIKSAAGGEAHMLNGGGGKDLYACKDKAKRPPPLGVQPGTLCQGRHWHGPAKNDCMTKMERCMGKKAESVWIKNLVQLLPKVPISELFDQLEETSRKRFEDWFASLAGLELEEHMQKKSSEELNDGALHRVTEHAKAFFCNTGMFVPPDIEFLYSVRLGHTDESMKTEYNERCGELQSADQCDLGGIQGMLEACKTRIGTAISLVMPNAKTKSVPQNAFRQLLRLERKNSFGLPVSSPPLYFDIAPKPIKPFTILKNAAQVVEGRESSMIGDKLRIPEMTGPRWAATDESIRQAELKISLVQNMNGKHRVQKAGQQQPSAVAAASASADMPAAAATAAAASPARADPQPPISPKAKAHHVHQAGSSKAGHPPKSPGSLRGTQAGDSATTKISLHRSDLKMKWGFHINKGNCVVTRVAERSPAAAAGLRVGCTISEIAGDRIWKKKEEKGGGTCLGKTFVQRALQNTLVKGYTFQLELLSKLCLLP